MREIKFRAKNIETNEWIYFKISEYPYTSIIDEETITQFTGLKDKNGKEIYEGDIVLIPDTYTDAITEDGRGPQEPDNHLSEVIYENGCFKFSVKERADILDKGHYTFDDLEGETGNDELEVIGNIYENKDLLKL